MQLELTALAAGLQLVEAPGLGALFEHLGDRLESESLPTFEGELIVVADNRGLASWLELRLADRLGFAAGIDILPPQGLADMLVRQHLPEQRMRVDRHGVQRDPFDRQSLTWRIEAHPPRRSRRAGWSVARLSPPYQARARRPVDAP